MRGNGKNKKSAVKKKKRRMAKNAEEHSKQSIDKK
jgi:hypothetical protein